MSVVVGHAASTARAVRRPEIVPGRPAVVPRSASSRVPAAPHYRAGGPQPGGDRGNEGYCGIGIQVSRGRVSCARQIVASAAAARSSVPWIGSSGFASPQEQGVGVVCAPPTTDNFRSCGNGAPTPL